MADNYLEKKFEEHLSAPYKSTRKSAPVTSRRAVVTGGAKGIGAAIVKALRVAGHKVSFCDIDEEAGRNTALHTGADFVLLDVADAHAFEGYLNSVAEKWDGIDIIVNNVGITDFKPLTQLTVEEFEHVQAVNVRPVLISGQVMARLREGKDMVKPYGRIVNICSTRQRQSEIGTEAYSASKGAIFSLTHALAMSLSQYGVTVNSISPGWIECQDYEALRPEDHAQHPSRRWGDLRT